MDIHILDTSIMLYVHSTILNGATLIGLQHFVKYLNYTGCIAHVIHYMALKLLFSLDASSSIRGVYNAQHLYSTSTGTSGLTYQEGHGCEIQLQHPNVGI